ncbi:MAG: AAA family ATPase [Ferruginibacter sp.]|nr:AAA family ATPase [Cytophagales bacterium]
MKTESNQPEYPYANVILYGPPGTGKTYHARHYALAAIRNLPPASVREADRDTVNRDYQQLADQERIQFVTFHPSFGYEDFIEGIKPDLNHDRPEVRFVLQDGIFKRMCILATHAILRAENTRPRPPDEGTGRAGKLDFDGLYVEFMAQQMNLLRRQVAVTYSLKRQRETTLRSVNEKGNLRLATGRHGRTYVVTRDKLRRLYGAYGEVAAIRRVATDIGRVIGGGNAPLYWAVFNELKEFEKRLEMDQFPEEAAEPEPDSGAAGRHSAVAYRTAARMAESLDWSGVSPESLDRADRYALIIDEINRGNVSQVFGELITLLEADKRGGRPEGLTVQLPYSKAAFTVPPNLYLIGTMNTADRNVEAIDTALRRRFAFVEMAPDYALLAARFGAGTTPDIARLLRAINRRVARLVGKDYAIGHAYFLDLSSAGDTAGLKGLFQHRLIPLLQEYFYGHEGKVELVIGEDFFERRGNSYGQGEAPYGEPDWAASNYEVQEDWAEYKGHPLRNLPGMDDEAFVRAVVRIYQR